MKFDNYHLIPAFKGIPFNPLFILNQLLKVNPVAVPNS